MFSHRRLTADEIAPLRRAELFSGVLKIRARLVNPSDTNQEIQWLEAPSTPRGYDEPFTDSHNTNFEGVQERSSKRNRVSETRSTRPSESQARSSQDSLSREESKSHHLILNGEGLRMLSQSFRDDPTQLSVGLDELVQGEDSSATDQPISVRDPDEPGAYFRSSEEEGSLSDIGEEDPFTQGDRPSVSQTSSFIQRQQPVQEIVNRMKKDIFPPEYSDDEDEDRASLLDDTNLDEQTLREMDVSMRRSMIIQSASRVDTEND